MAKPLEVFVSYAHEDLKYVDTLKKHLALLIRRGFLGVWTDREIIAGQEWSEVINARIRSCQIVLFLISADFMDSTYIMNTEMKAAVERYRNGDARIIPIYLRTYNNWQKTSLGWGGATLGDLQALPINNRGQLQPVVAWRIKDEAYSKVAEGIERLAENLGHRGKDEALKKKWTAKVTTTKSTGSQPKKARPGFPMAAPGGLEGLSAVRSPTRTAAAAKGSSKPVAYRLTDEEDGSVYKGPGPEDDPWKGFADGHDKVGDFVISCTGIKPLRDYDKTWMCRVDIQIRRAGRAPEPWRAKFLMHPTFYKTERILRAEPERRVAKEFFWSMGQFVIGAVVIVDGNEVARLELDLEKKVKGTKIDKAPADWWAR